MRHTTLKDRIKFKVNEVENRSAVINYTVESYFIQVTMRHSRDTLDAEVITSVVNVGY